MSLTLWFGNLRPTSSSICWAAGELFSGFILIILKLPSLQTAEGCSAPEETKKCQLFYFFTVIFLRYLFPSCVQLFLKLCLGWHGYCGYLVVCRHKLLGNSGVWAITLKRENSFKWFFLSHFLSIAWWPVYLSSYWQIHALVSKAAAGGSLLFFAFLLQIITLFDITHPYKTHIRKNQDNL